MPLTNVGLRFSNGLVVGRWDIPSPTSDPKKFNKVAEDIGYHITLAIARGAEGCFFIDMNDDKDVLRDR